MVDGERTKAIARALRFVRGRRGQRAFAADVGISQQAVSKYESGEIPRSWLFLARLAESEDVDLNDVLLGRMGGNGS